MEIYVDGSIKRLAFHIVDGLEGTLPMPEVGKTPTNNEAEYWAVISGLMIAMQEEAQEVTIYSDSQLVVNQVNEEYKCNKPYLSMLRDVVFLYMNSFPNAQVKWVAREQNKAGWLLD